MVLFKDKYNKDEIGSVEFAKEMVSLANDIKKLRTESEKVIKQKNNISYEDSILEIPQNIVRRIKKRTSKIYNKYYKYKLDGKSFAEIGIDAVERYDEWFALANT